MMSWWMKRQALVSVPQPGIPRPSFGDAPSDAVAETEILARVLDIPLEVAAMLTPEQTHRALGRLQRLVRRLTQHVDSPSHLEPRANTVKGPWPDQPSRRASD
jgi:hypothetical protein